MLDETFYGARWHRLVPPGDRFGVSCDAEGPSIGPVRLFERTESGLKPRSTNELDFVLSLALGRVTDFAAKMSGLDAVARALDAGDLARAMIATQLTHLPTLPDDGAFRRALRADTLAKAGFDPGQPRDDHGRWTADGSSESVPGSSEGFDPAYLRPAQAEIVVPPVWDILPARPLPPIPPFPGDILPPTFGNPDIPLPRTLDNPFPKDPKCVKEWRDAKKYCDQLKDRGLIGKDGYGGVAPTYEKCLRGQVSERCGGNPIGRPGRGRSAYDIMASA